MSRLLRFIVLTAATAACLSQYATNGRSAWGTLPSPQLPKFLTDGPLEDGLPWGSANPAGEPPDTGVTRHYHFSITRGFKAPDGFNKSVILVNDQFPGPVIEANWGDMIEVTVVNNIDSPDEGATMHWHGMTLKNAPWYDGVPGVSQCPITPRGGKFTYTFQADQFGTGWYHSHYSAQYDDGLYGPMVIYGPVQPEVSYDHDLGPVMISDYFHISYNKALELSFSKPPLPLSVDNNLINGKGAYDCNSTKTHRGCLPGAGHAKFQFKSGKRYRLRLINTGSLANQKFSIDNHEMTVIANDYVPVKPYNTRVVTLGAGQRTDVIVHATGSPRDAVWMRSDIDMVCLQTTATIPTALAAIYYESANTDHPPKTNGSSWESNNCRNDPLSQTVPYYPLAPPEPETVQTVTVTVGLNATGYAVMFMDGSSFRADYHHPALLGAKAGNLSFPTERNIYNFGSNSSVRLILNNMYGTVHPMHLHGHNFWVLAEGLGTWDGEITNPSNPLRRDTHNMQPGTPDQPSYVVLEWRQDNPGIWPFHCHMSVHSSAGMVILALEQPDLIEELRIPMVIRQSCRSWEQFKSPSLVKQIDSGI
ncbi:multicopper oxidase-domain-containing protein [Aspergillus caelatus]|uniref:Multicopper oxidase-domain-containing protein n=1 Tax=Aspergillus caelatus TaxID=61420 RepID=A0A5N6ZLZ4_9EURO|nr:multicopper oxidase-domain-containing protein [Aspergillus caelatus]KAE8357839.1 multicopper oxidase-domain-containing protein [Aspergillus caelatus]